MVTGVHAGQVGHVVGTPAKVGLGPVPEAVRKKDRDELPVAKEGRPE